MSFIPVANGQIGNQRLPVELGWAPPQTEILFTSGIREIAAELIKELPTDVPFLYNPGMSAKHSF
jgi:hypothetical protein